MFNWLRFIGAFPEKKTPIVISSSDRPLQVKTYRATEANVLKTHFNPISQVLYLNGKAFEVASASNLSNALVDKANIQGNIC